MKVLVTGCAGFIGMHVTRRLLARGDEVVGIDNLNDYYDPQLKRARLGTLTLEPGFRFVAGDIADPGTVQAVLSGAAAHRVVHLAAEVGVRNSVAHPERYVRTNLVGFGHVLEACRQCRVEHLVYASSSSVYGADEQVPFSVHSPTDHPVSLYAATKKSNELMAHVYGHLHGLPTTGLRYFTVYGPWGRPDMSPWLFASAIVEGRPIEVFNHGQMRRDFTYVDDIAEGTVRALDHVPQRGSVAPGAAVHAACEAAPYRVYNLGNGRPVELTAFIATLEDALHLEARKKELPMQPGDVPVTCADITETKRELGFEPQVPLTTGVGRFVEWYLAYRQQPRVGRATAQRPTIERRRAPRARWWVPEQGEGGRPAA